MDEIEREFLDNIISDLLAHPPRLVLVNTTWKFDYIKYYSQDARFVQFWADYVFLEQVDYDEPPFANRRSIQVFQYLSPADYVPAFTQKLRLINPTDKPCVYAYIWHNHQTETYLLDDSSQGGKEYEIEWTIGTTAFQFKGTHKQHDSSITTLSPGQPLAMAVAFTDDLSRTSQNIFERRFYFALTDDDRIGVLLPPEEWHNPHWPDESGWQMEDIDGVMTDR
jgi:hypothetical protein